MENLFIQCNENSGDKPGEASAFAFDKKKGELTFLNKQPTDGFAPASITVDESGKECNYCKL